MNFKDIVHCMRKLGHICPIDLRRGSDISLSYWNSESGVVMLRYWSNRERCAKNRRRRSCWRRDGVLRVKVKFLFRSRSRKFLHQTHQNKFNKIVLLLEHSESKWGMEMLYKSHKCSWFTWQVRPSSLLVNMSKPTAGNYYILNRVLSPDGEELALTFNGVDRYVTVTPFIRSNSNQHVSCSWFICYTKCLSFIEIVADNWFQWGNTICFSKLRHSYSNRLGEGRCHRPSQRQLCLDHQDSWRWNYVGWFSFEYFSMNWLKRTASIRDGDDTVYWGLNTAVLGETVGIGGGVNPSFGQRWYLSRA